ncbi:hypothetical protein G4G27_17280 [Sphingomonas sp. So64.6b]|uniref:hypothetical protein n=1 Tax=Sphingomonas sp. So64.6b TaxID=2997354 RepID=UPI001602F457|nr:hypothetical protein [Sphingomonas sp. So64.6b]QNA85539.1 hypothetical protein G4G27_17280 [Sphingomonas sp. So64.6b]
MDTILSPADFFVEFASPEWFDIYQKVSIAACRLGMVAQGVTCEVCHDVPAHLASDGMLAWTRRVEGKSCSLDLVECPDDEAYTKIRADYAALLPLARFLIGTNDSAFQALAMEAVANGKLEIIRHMPSAGPSNHIVHNMMAALTR